MTNKLVSKPGLGRRLTNVEKIAILTDLEKKRPYKEIIETYQISEGTIHAIRHAEMQNVEAADAIKKGRTNRLYTVSERFLDVLDDRDLEKLSIRDSATVFGILEDKIAQREGRVGNVNIALVKLSSLGMIQKP